jgi:hypothetical protein
LGTVRKLNILFGKVEFQFYQGGKILELFA